MLIAEKVLLLVLNEKKNKFYLYRRTVRSRGIFYVINPLRFYRGLSSYFKWKKIVLKNLDGLKKKEIKQIRSGNLDHMKDLKKGIESYAF